MSAAQVGCVCAWETHKTASSFNEARHFRQLQQCANAAQYYSPLSLLLEPRFVAACAAQSTYNSRAAVDSMQPEMR